MKEVKKNKEFDKMIIEAVLGKYSFFIWQSIDGIIEKCETKIKAVRNDYNEIELAVEKNQEVQLEKVIPGNRTLNIFVPELSVSFLTGLKSISVDKKIKIHLPSEYTFYNRRSDERIQPTKTAYANFELNKKITKKSLFDISVGGFSFIVSQADTMAVKRERQSNLFFLEFAGRKFKVNAECVSSVKIDRHKLDDLPYGGVKLGFRFVEISKNDKDFLIELIMHESLTKQFSKKAN